MKPLSIATLAQMLGAKVETTPDTSVTGISTDSRTTAPGECFFALAGENFDGHAYVNAAFARGAACAVVSQATSADGATLKVGDTIQALGNLAGAYRREQTFKVVAITGSVGKTTTRQIIHHVLSRHFRARQARKNFNNTIGLPLTLLEAEPEDEIIVAELGANQPGEIAYLTRIARPEVAVVTNVHPVHLAGFGDLATITREKVSIAEGLTENGLFVVNGDIEHLVKACSDMTGPVKTFGRT